MRTSPLPIILIFIALFTLSHADTLSITLSSYGINAAGVSYTFTLSSGSSVRTVAKNTVYTITFPSDYTNIFPTTIGCEDGVTSATLTCSRSNNVVTITDYFSSQKSDVIFSVRLKGLNNPAHTSTTGSFTATIPASASSVQISATSTVSITAGTSSCVITPASYVTGATTSMKFDITTSNPIPASGGLEVAPVQKWPFQTDYLLPGSSDGFSCTITSPTSATLSDCYVANNKLQIRSMTSTAIPAGTVLSITITGMKNPPMTTAYTYTVSTLDSNSLPIDKCSPTVTPTTTNALTVGLTDDDFFLFCTSGSNQKLINTYDTCLLTFKTTNPLPSGSSVDITFPSTVGLTQLTSIVNGVTNLDFNRNSGSSLVSISSVVSSYTPGSTSISLRFTTIRQPATTKPTGSFQISTSYNGFSIDTISSGAIYSASAGTLSSVAVSSTPTAAGSTSASMTFSFVISNALTTSATVAISFPSTISVSDATSASCSGSGSKMASSPSCAISSKVLTVSNFASSSLNTGDTVTVTLNNAVTLPGSTRPTATFTVQTQDGGYTVDQDASATFTATAGAIVSRSVSVASGGIVGGISTYTFTFTNANPIPSTSKIQVAFPTDDSFAVSDSTAMAQGVQVTVGAGTASTVTSTVVTASSPNTVTFTNPTGAAIDAGTQIVFTVPSIRNPLSTASTSSFTLSTITSAGYVIDTTSSGLALIANSVSAADFYSVNLVLSPSTTGSSSTYKFKIIPSIAQASTNRVLITFPTSTFSFSGSVSCQIVAPVSKNAATCTPSSNIFTLTLNQAVAALEEFEVDIIGVSNPVAASSYSGFAISTQLSGGAQVHSRSSGISVAITPSTITTASVSPSTKALSTAATYTFTFTPANPYPSGAFIQMTVPVELSLQVNPVCSGFIGISTALPCAITEGTTNVITLNGTGSYSSSGIQFSIASIVNQASQIDSSSFVLYVKTSDGLIIDQLTSGLVAQSPCNSNCLSCSSTNRDQCLTCPATGNNLLNVPTSTCVSSCGAGTYENSAGTQCVLCNSRCKECEGTATTCTACDTSASSSTPYLYNNNCQSFCPSGYYSDPSTKVCGECVSPCKTCTGSSTTCNSCVDNTFLFNNDCKPTCSDGYYPDSSTWKCEPCASNCLTCSSLSVCKSCSSSGSYPIFHEGSCLSQCPSGTFRSGNTCIACVSPCTTCSVSADTCLTCIQGLYPDNGECRTCSSACATCSGSPTSCASCKQGSYLQGSTCVTQCSDGYYLDAGTSSCKVCSTNCLTCSSLNKCTTCDSSSNHPYLYPATSACVSSCPAELPTVENGVCVESNYVAFVNPYSGLYLSGLPFPFIIFGAILCGLVGVGKIISSNTIVLSNIIGFLGLIEFSAWIAMVILLILSHPGDPISDFVGFPIIIVAIATLFILNIIFYFRLIRPQVKSEQFLNWKKQKKSHKIIAIVIQTLSLVCFKAFRLLYSRFFGLEFMSVELNEPKVFLKRLHKYTGINFAISVLPALIAAIITLNQDASDYEQLLRISVEVLVISLILMILSIYDGFRTNELERSAENTGITAIMHGQVLEMLEKTIMDKLNESIDSRKRPQSKLNAYRRRNSLNLDQSYEYNEANSSFLNLNRTEKNLTGAGNKHDESFADSVDGVIGRDAQGNAIRAVKAIEEIEKDDDDEPTLNMKNKTLGQLRDMLKDRGHDLEPDKIMIENKDGSVIVLRDKSSYIQNNMNMNKTSPSKSQVSSIRGIDEEAGRTRMSKFVSEDEEYTKLTGRKQGNPSSGRGIQDRAVELDENGQPKNGISPSKRNESHHIIATGGSQKTGVLYDSEEELELHDSYGNLEAKLGKTSTNLETLGRGLENLSPIAGRAGMIGSRGAIDNTPDRTIQKDLDDDQEEEELEVQSQTPSKANPRQSAEENQMRSSPGFAGKPPTGRKGNKSSAKKNANNSGLKDSKESGNNGFEYVSSDSQLSVEDVNDHFQDDTPSNYDALNQRFDENLYQQQLGNMGKRPDSRATNASNAQNMSTMSIPKTSLPPVNEVKESHRAPVYMHNYISDGMEEGDLPPVRGRSIESNQSQNNNNNSVLQRNKNKVVPFAPTSERANSMGKRAMTPQHNMGTRTAQTNSSRGFDTQSNSRSNRQELNKTVKNFHRAANERENHRKPGSKVFDSQRDGRSSSRERPGSVDKMKRLEGIYANKVIVPRLNRINSKSSNKVANSRGFIDDDIDNDGLELHDFGKFENIVNGMKKQTSSRALDDSNQH